MSINKSINKNWRNVWVPNHCGVISHNVLTLQKLSVACTRYILCLSSPVKLGPGHAGMMQGGLNFAHLIQNNNVINITFDFIAEKPPGTTKVISGRKLQLIKKSIPNSSDGKPTQRTMTLSSATIVDPSLGSKVTAQTGATNLSSKGSASSNAGSGVVLKSMISVTPMVRNRDCVTASPSSLREKCYPV